MSNDETPQSLTAGDSDWLSQVDEAVLDPDRRIVDPHHHLWPPGGLLDYGPDELVADTASGHNVVATMFVECFSAYRTDGPEHLRCVGETEFVASQADWLAENRPESPPIAGIVGFADLADGDRLDEVLDAHVAVAGGRFRGIRDAIALAAEPEAMMIPGANRPGKSREDDFREGVRRLGERGFTYDSWHYHHQNHEFVELARAVPTTTMILDHFGTPVGVGSFAARRDEIFETWAADIIEIANCPNVVVKVGGLAMPDNGFGWHEADRPPSSDELIEAQGRYYQHTIETFGPERCMFESNFPVDRFSLSYRVYWNAAQKMSAHLSDADQDALFSGTAARVYSLDV